jgi:hypothetical protein
MPRRRFEVLVSIPEDLRFIRRQIDAAELLEPDDQARTTAILAAAGRADELMARLIESPPLWLALQRQFLVHGWSFKDLKELKGLRVDAYPIVKVLGELHGSLLPDGQRDIPDPKGLVEDAWKQFGRVQNQALRNMKDSGLAFEDGNAPVWVQARDATVVDQTHEQLQRLRDYLNWLLLDARHHESQRQAHQELDQAGHDEELRESERRWEKILKVCVETVTVVASITTVIVQAPEIWQDIEPYATELVRMVGQVGDSLGRQVNALLGMVIAIRQAELALGVDPGDGIDWLNRPSDDLSPTGDPSDVSVDSPQQQVSEQITGAGDVPVEADSSPQQHIREGFVDATVRASGAPSDPHFDPTDPPYPEGIDDPGRFGRGDPSALEELERLAAEATRPPDPNDDDIHPWGPGSPSPGGSF